VSLALDVVRGGLYRVGVGWVTIDHKATQLKVTLDGNQWLLQTGNRQYQCEALQSAPLALKKGEHVLRLEPGQNPIAVDWVELESAE